MKLPSCLYKRVHLFKTIREMMDSKVAEVTAIVSELRENVLRDKAIHCTELGVSQERYCEYELIVSLTTYGHRIYDVCLAIESIMQGSLLPNRIVLWLGEDFKGRTLPRALQNQVNRGLEIQFCRDMMSYKKLIPSLNRYPNAIIVTIDDDMIYSQEMLEGLFQSYQCAPQAIHANRLHNMTFSENGNLKSYLEWEQEVSVAKHPFFTTGGGVLFPPNSLPNETLNEAVFTQICGFADDVWFNAMAILNNTKIVKVETRSPKGTEYYPLISVREQGLWEENTNSNYCRNDEQIKAVFTKYAIYSKLNR